MQFARRSRTSEKTWMLAGAGLGAAATALVAFLDKRRRHIARDKTASVLRKGGREVARNAEYAQGVARGVAHKVTPDTGAPRVYDDVTLARKVESEIFRPADAPKGSVSVSAHDGVVELRGQVKRPEQVRALAEAAKRVDGVADIRNMLHTPV